MRAVAERFVLRCPAAAQRDAVTDLVLEAVRCSHRNCAARPDRTAQPLERILDDADRLGQRRLDGLAGGPLESLEPPRWAVADLPDERRANRVIVGAFDLAPNRAVRIAEARGCAQRLGVGEREHGTLRELRLLPVRLPARGLGAVEGDLLVRAIAERLGVRVAAAAQRVALPRREGLARLPLPRSAFGVGDDALLRERHTARDQIRTVLRNHHSGLAADG